MRVIPAFGILSCIFVIVSKQCLSFEIEPFNEASSLLSSTLASSDSDWESFSCRDISLIETKEQCRFVTQKCSSEEYQLGSLNIFKFCYCSTSHKTVRDLIILPTITFLLILIFVILGVIASKYLCPNLSNISSFFNIPDNLSGLTLLAFGNGSPDILGTYASFNSNNASLAIGELIGAGFFITCFIIGMMAVIHPFDIIGQEKVSDINDDNGELSAAEIKNDKLVYVRDLVIFIGSIIILMITLVDGKLTTLKSMMMCLMYISYVIIILLWNWIFKVRQLNVMNDNKIRLMYNDESILDIFSSSDDDFSDRYEIVNEATMRVPSSLSDSQYRNPIRNSVFDFLEFSNVLSDLQSHQSLPLSFLKNQIPQKIRRGTDSSRAYSDSESQIDESRYESLHTNFHGGDEEEEEEDDDEQPHVLYDNFTRQHMESQNRNLSNSTDEEISNGKLDIKNIIVGVLKTVIKYVSNPINFVLSISIPVRVESDMNDREEVHLKLSFNQLLKLFSQLMIFPLLFFLAFLRDSSVATKIILPLLLQILTCIFFYISYQILTSSFPSISHIRLINITLSFVGFVASISWISILAQELINILKFISIFSRMSDAILGLTIFAMGNSIGDLISNVTMAKLGYPLMALAACFGGPLLNLLLGIGVNGLISSQGDSLEFSLSPSLKITCVCLLLNLCFLLFYIPAKGWRFDRSTGLIMICIWCTCTTINVIIELLSQ